MINKKEINENENLQRELTAEEKKILDDYKARYPEYDIGYIIIDDQLIICRNIGFVDYKNTVKEFGTLQLKREAELTRLRNKYIKYSENGDAKEIAPEFYEELAKLDNIEESEYYIDKFTSIGIIYPDDIKERIKKGTLAIYKIYKIYDLIMKLTLADIDVKVNNSSGNE